MDKTTVIEMSQSKAYELEKWIEAQRFKHSWADGVGWVDRDIPPVLEDLRILLIMARTK